MAPRALRVGESVGDWKDRVVCSWVRCAVETAEGSRAAALPRVFLVTDFVPTCYVTLFLTKRALLSLQLRSGLFALMQSAVFAPGV